MRRSTACAVLLVLWLCASPRMLLGAAPAPLNKKNFRLALHYNDVSGVARKNWPVRGGVPLPKGLLPKGAEGRLRLLGGGGRALPMHARVLAAWPDGSAKWVLLDTQVNLAPNAQAVFTLTTGAPAAPEHPVQVTEDGNAIAVDTGVLRFQVRKQLPGGLSRVVLNGKTWPEFGLGGGPVLDYQAEGPPLNSMKLRGNWKRNEKPGAQTVRLTAAAGKDYSAKVELRTPMRVVIRTSGWYGAPGASPACRYIIRYTAFAGRPFIKIEHTFIFTENPKTFFIRRLGLRFAFGKAGSVRFGGGIEAPQGHALSLAAGQSAALFSPGPDVVNHNNVLPPEGAKKDPRYSVFTFTGSGAKASQRQEKAHGHEALGLMTLLGQGRGLSVTVRDFWEQHPDELAYDAKDGAAEVWLWARHGGKVVDSRNPKFNLRIRGETRLGGISTGFAKTQDIFLHFHAAKDARAAAATAHAFDHPVWPSASPEWTCAAKVIPAQHPYDPKRFPGLERQIGILYAWIEKNQRQLHWDGFFDYGGVLIEFDNHGQRYSGGRRGTWVWRDYAGWINEDGQQTHHCFQHYLRTGRREYMRIGEAMVRRITEVCTIHHYNPKVPHADRRIGGGHRHDMTPWHSFVTGYSMATLGAVDYYYLTGDERMGEILDLYARRCDRDGIGAGYGGAHFKASLIRIAEARGNARFKQAALAKLLNRGVTKEALHPHFRTPTDLYPHLILQEQILEDKPTAQLLLKAAATVRRTMMGEVYAWAYLRTKDAKFLEKVKGEYARLKKKAAAAAKLGDPWKMDWKALRAAMNRMPVWYVKVYINSQELGRYPAIMQALVAGGVVK